MRWTLAIVALASRMAAAHADEDVWSHHFAAEFHLSLSSIEAYKFKGGPFGNIGGAIDVTIAQWLGVAVGGGWSADGAQWAVMPRLRYADGGSAASLGVGITGGRYDPGVNLNNMGGATWDSAFWIDVEGGFEHRWPIGILIRVYLGIAHILNT